MITNYGNKSYDLSKSHHLLKVCAIYNAVWVQEIFINLSENHSSIWHKPRQIGVVFQTLLTFITNCD
jgi:hypothetical protein